MIAKLSSSSAATVAVKALFNTGHHFENFHLILERLVFQTVKTLARVGSY
jgi:hypothetical protein